MKLVFVGGRGYFASRVVDTLQEHKIITVDTHTGPSSHVQASITDTKKLTQAFQKADAVVNFVGLSPVRKPTKTTYEEIHVTGASSFVQAAKQANVPHILHISALGADVNAKTAYLRTKAAGEQHINTHQQACIIRPGVLLSEDNELVRGLAKASVTRMFAKTPGLMQPVDVSAAASYVVSCITKQKTGIHEIAGPDILHLSDIAKLVYVHNNRQCWLLPSWCARLGATTLAVLPRTRIGFDQVRSLALHNTIIPQSNITQEVIGSSITEYLFNT